MAKKKVVRKDNGSHPVTKPSADKSGNWNGTENLYFVEEGDSPDSKHQFKAQMSDIYGTKELYWTGPIKKGTIAFERKDGQNVPTRADSNHGYTLVGKARDFFSAENALVVLSESGDQAYVYIQPESHLKYIGDGNVHTIYVRVYDNNNGYDNDRWLTLSIE